METGNFDGKKTNTLQAVGKLNKNAKSIKQCHSNLYFICLDFFLDHRSSIKTSFFQNKKKKPE
jgi:hypothetical protein